MILICFQREIQYKWENQKKKSNQIKMVEFKSQVAGGVART